MRAIHHRIMSLFLAAAVVAACSNELAKADELLATGDFAGAKAIYEARLQKKPADGAGTIGLARTLYLEALEKSRTGEDTVDDWNAVVEIMEKAVIIDPAPEGVQPVSADMMADSLFRCGMKRFESEDWAGAADHLSQAEEKDKKTAELYTTLARARANSGETEEALEAATRALGLDKGNVSLMREAAGWANEAGLPWMHHRFFAMAEKAKPSGIGVRPPAKITGALTQKYKALNMMNDVLGTFLFEEVLGKAEWDGLVEREALLTDMEKFIGKKPPRDFASADRARLHWVVYHYWNVAGVVFLYMGDFDRARTWFEKADEVARSGKVKNPDVPDDELEKELAWAEENLKLVP